MQTLRAVVPGLRISEAEQFGSLLASALVIHNRNIVSKMGKTIQWLVEPLRGGKGITSEDHGSLFNNFLELFRCIQKLLPNSSKPKLTLVVSQLGHGMESFVTVYCDYLEAIPDACQTYSRLAASHHCKKLFEKGLAAVGAAEGFEGLLLDPIRWLAGVASLCSLASQTPVGSSIESEQVQAVLRSIVEQTRRSGGWAAAALEAETHRLQAPTPEAPAQEPQSLLRTASQVLAR